MKLKGIALRDIEAVTFVEPLNDEASGKGELSYESYSHPPEFRPIVDFEKLKNGLQGQGSLETVSGLRAAACLRRLISQATPNKS